MVDDVKSVKRAFHRLLHNFDIHKALVNSRQSCRQTSPRPAYDAGAHAVEPKSAVPDTVITLNILERAINSTRALSHKLTLRATPGRAARSGPESLIVPVGFLTGVNVLNSYRGEEKLQ